MVTINFEIEGFDLADIIKAVAGEVGVNINIYTLQEVGGSVPEGVVNHVAIEEVALTEEDEIQLIDESLTFDEKNDFALKMREEGSSWAQVGLALGISAKSASRRLKLHASKKQNALAKSERKAKAIAAEMIKPEFAGFSDKELIQGIHSTVSAKGSDGGKIYLSSDYATIMESITAKKGYRDTPLLREFKQNIQDRCDDLFRKVGMCLGVGVAISGNTIDSLGNRTVQIMIISPKKVPTYDTLVEVMETAGEL